MVMSSLDFCWKINNLNTPASECRLFIVSNDKMKNVFDYGDLTLGLYY